MVFLLFYPKLMGAETAQAREEHSHMPTTGLDISRLPMPEFLKALEDTYGQPLGVFQAACAAN